jgi:flagellar hook assembly protein FlgD
VSVPCYATSADDVPVPRTTLHQNYPNPFNPATTISFDLAQPGHVRLDVFDVAGRRVATLVDGVRAAGLSRATWDGRDSHGQPVSSGVYFYRLMAGGTLQTKKMVLLK